MGGRGSFTEGGCVPGGLMAPSLSGMVAASVGVVEVGSMKITN
jgi:hypothetical protein